MRTLPTLMLLAFASIALSYPLADTDIWWHLSAGREIFSSGRVLFSDPFCASSLGFAWTDLHWGFQIGAWSIWTIFGAWGLVGTRVLLAFAIFTVAFGRKMAITAALAGAFALWISRPFLDARPLLVTLLVLAALQRWLEADSACAKRRTFLLAIVGQIVLANTQGLFLLGPLLVGVYSLGSFLDKRKADGSRLGMLALAMIAASLVNPWGWSAFALAGKVAGRIAPTAANLFSSEIPENAPLWTEAVRSPSTVLLLAWLVASVWLFWKRDAHSRTRMVLLVGTGLLSIAAIRNLPLLCLEIAFCLDFSARPALVKIWSWSAAAIVSTLFVVSIRERRWNLPFDPVAPLRLPSSEAIEIIQRDPAPVFHEIRAGGWLSWNAPSRGLCWADTRLVLHDAEFVRQYLDVADRPDRFTDFSRRWNFGYALLPIVEFDRFRPLAAFLLQSDEWQLLHCDGAWVLFGHRSPPSVNNRTATATDMSESVQRRFGANLLLERRVRDNLQAYLSLTGRSP
ncbi:MAG: hypothetical protein AAB214_14135 [Fibrobacterota bacterium]